jgi:hypothetical protein
MKLAAEVVTSVDAKADEGGDAAPVIDRSGGPGGRRRLPVTK